MKRLLVMRHAKSDRTHVPQPDFDRPLTRRGHKDAERVAAFLAGAAPPDLVLSSAARRAHLTAAALCSTLADRLGAAPELVVDGRLYLAGAEVLAATLAAAAGRAATAVVIAHNPGVEGWVGQLTGAWLHLPTAAVACVASDAEDWSTAATSRGRLQWLITPRVLKSGIPPGS